MPVFKDYSETGELLQVREEPLTEANFMRYMKINGMAAAQGYVEAVAAVTNEIASSFSTEIEDDRLINASKHTKGRRTIKNQRRRIQFLENAKQLLEISEDNLSVAPEYKINLNKDISYDLNDWVKYIQTNGKQKAKGYLEAVEDLTREVSNHLTIIKHQFKSDRSPEYVYKRIHNIYGERWNFIKFAEPLLSPNK